MHLYKTSTSIYVFLLIILFNYTRGSILDYIPLGKSLFGQSQTEYENSDVSLRKVLYEVEITDEKFIEQAAKYTGVALSDLDKCQHRVIFKLQEECHKLNDEELAKLAVKLLNCQSEIEGRKLYPCTDQMPIRDCTSSMDPDTWNSYLLMSNRARAVCYSIRQAQFRGLTELTVNKLMGAAHEQLGIMSRLEKGQNKIEQATSNTIKTIVNGNQALKDQQDDIRQAQLYGQLALEDNIRRLADEKQLILDGHEELTRLTKNVQMKLEEASQQLDAQSEERKDNHKEILNDLIEIQTQARDIFKRIEESSQHMLEQSKIAAEQYEATLSQLAQVNSTVYALVDVVTSTRAALEEKLKWLSEALGGTDDAVERLYLFMGHISYLILAMVSCAFLQVPVPSRIALVILVPLNMLVAIQQGSINALSFLGLSIVLISFIAVQTVCSCALYYWQKHSAKNLSLENNNLSLNSTFKNDISKMESDNDNEAEAENTFNTTHLGYSTLSDSFSFRNGSTYKRYVSDSIDSPSDYYHEDFPSPTPPLSRPSRSRSKTPQIPNGNERRKCNGTTRMGTPCKSTTLIGRDYCYRHQTGSSVMIN